MKEELLTALGLVLVLEGLPYFAMPERMQEAMKVLSEAHPSLVRALGGAALALGLLLLYLVRRTGVFGE